MSSPLIITQFFSSLLRSPVIRRRILFVLLGILVFRIAAHIPVPGADLAVLASLLERNAALSTFSLLTGGSLATFSVVLMGLAPYINASIIVQLMTVVIPQWEALSKEGDSGQRKLRQYTRYLAVPLALLQSYGMILLLNTLSGGMPVVANTNQPGVIIPIMLAITAGSIFLMWLGELMTERGIGNGISLLIFSSIVAGLPSILGQLAGTGDIFSGSTLVIAAFTLAILVFVIWFTEARRDVPVVYASRSTTAGGIQSALPLRVNQAGMIPIIFALSIVTLPTIAANLLANSANMQLRTASTWVLTNLNPNDPGLIYGVLFFALVLFFTYFYISITVQPQQIAENMQKRGGFVPGVRPGAQTAELIRSTVYYLSLLGGFFLALVSISPFIFQNALAQFGVATSVQIISGAAIIIVASVVSEIIRQLRASLTARDYDKFL